MVKQHLRLKRGLPPDWVFNDKDLICSTRGKPSTRKLGKKDMVFLFHPSSHLLSLPFFLLSSLLSLLPNFLFSERLHISQATSPRGHVWLAGHLKLSDFFLQSLTPTLSRKSWRAETCFPPPTGAPGRSSVVAHTLASPLPSCVTRRQLLHRSGASDFSCIQRE